jgi:hypothetical protein
MAMTELQPQDEPLDCRIHDDDGIVINQCVRYNIAYLRIPLDFSPL